MQTGSTDRLLTLRVRREGRQAEELFVQHGLSIGSNTSNAVQIEGEGIARIHAVVIRAIDGFVVQCQTPEARIHLPDGTLSTETALKPGTVFRIGNVEFRALRQTTSGRVIVTDEPWKVCCPRCRVSLADESKGLSQCPGCGLKITYAAVADGGFSGWLPREIPGYRIDAVIGVGGMGVVTRGADAGDRIAAIKLVGLKDTAADQGRRLRQEVAALSTVSHPNIVHLISHGEDQHLQWIIMEWVDGLPLDRWAVGASNGGKLDTDHIRRVVGQLAGAVAHLHKNGIVHRDLKPSNVLIDRYGNVRLTDLGIARIQADAQATLVTATGVVAGTVGYMAPEQAFGLRATSASDVYSLGVIWGELCIGTRPVAGQDVTTGMAGRPEGWATLVKRCLSPKAEERPLATALVVCTQASMRQLASPRRLGPAAKRVGVGLMSLLALVIVAMNVRNVSKDVAQVLSGDQVTSPAQSASPSVNVQLTAQQAYAKGRDYEMGHGVPQSYAKAMDWYRKAADEGDPAAMNAIGVLYHNGLGITQSYGEAMAWYGRAVEKGDSYAMRNIGVLYANGQGVTQSDAEAMKWYRKAADAGNPNAMCNVGELYLYGSGVPKSIPEARVWYLAAAAAGNSDAMYKVGQLYSSGLGGEQNYSQAMVWYRKASDQGNADAMISVGFLYANGLGVEKSIPEAMAWYRKAADAGHPEAVRKIGELH